MVQMIDPREPRMLSEAAPRLCEACNGAGWTVWGEPPEVERCGCNPKVSDAN